MKIQKVIHSSDDNPMYLDFWPIVSKVWKKFFNIEPVLLYFGNQNISNEFGTIIKIPKIDNIPIAIQTLWSRYWYPQNEPETTFMISDIDMIPLSKWYFIENIKNINDDKYVHINPCIESYGMLPSCYHIAKGKIFKDKLHLQDNFKDSINTLLSFFNGKSDTNHPSLDFGWFYDEKYATHQLLSDQNDLILLPRPQGQEGRRIDRSFWNYDSELLKQGYYYDSHSVRPYSLYKKHIDELCSILLGE